MWKPFTWSDVAGEHTVCPPRVFQRRPASGRCWELAGWRGVFAQGSPMGGVAVEYKLDRNLENWYHLEIGLAGLYQLELYFGIYVTWPFWTSMFSNGKLLWWHLPVKSVVRIHHRTHGKGLADAGHTFGPIVGDGGCVLSSSVLERAFL